MFLVGDKAYVIDGTVARPANPDMLRRELSKTPLGGRVAEALKSQAQVGKNIGFDERWHQIGVATCKSSS